ncbi:glucuronate isomerase [Lewinellaceae bacterium SD302]|nr:glucuronate isomerase [Lewinellaceae bacterium SD302]
MKPFLNENFILQNRFAERLYHDYAAGQPIIDYHNHLSPMDLAQNRRFTDITAAWLEGDHYKWRAMRANGIPEELITGKAGGLDKFRAWAATVPKTLRNPLYHWTHLELQRYFGIEELLSAANADRIYERTTARLREDSHRAQGLLQQMKVEVICTTDHPTDRLEFHNAHHEARVQPIMLPTFRPDRYLYAGGGFADYITSLEKAAEVEIQSFGKLVEALEKRIDFFGDHGCQLADHGLACLYPLDFKDARLDDILARARRGETLAPLEKQQFQMALLHELGKLYAERDWTMQLHLGPLRNNNSRLVKLIGADVGADSIGDLPQANGLAFFLDALDVIGRLPKTILYNLNPRDNELFATMAGNFNDGSRAGKIQWGSAWWFLDQKDGMEKQFNTLSNMGLLSRFVGMLTDSRSFLSFPRHEYFRRILCNLIGQDVEQGLLPHDEKLLGEMVADICYRNARDYFNFTRESQDV